MRRRGGGLILCATLAIMLACVAVSCRQEPVFEPDQTPLPTQPGPELTPTPPAATPGDTPLPTPGQTAQPTPTPDVTPSPEPTPTEAPTPSPSPTRAPAATKAPAASKPPATDKPPAAATPVPTQAPTKAPAAVTPKPVVTATPVPTQAPTATPAQYPTPVIDTSTAKDGYITVRYTRAKDVKYKVRLELGSQYENYALEGNGAKETFPVKLGTGDYRVLVLENIGGTSYRIIASANFTLQATNEFGPYLKPNPHVNYNDGMSCIQFSRNLVSGLSSDAEKAKAIYNWVRSNIKYDHSKVDTLPAGYLPNPETTFTTRKGICYDFASLLAAMCRANGIPAKLIIGTADGISGLHAWNNVYFDGAWHRYDASTASQGATASNYKYQAVY